MFLKRWFRPPRHLLVIFLVIVLLPSTLLAISGWRLMLQEEARSSEERQAQMADAVVAELRQRIGSIDAQLRQPRTVSTPVSNRDDFVFVQFDGDQAITSPDNRLLFYPVPVAGHEVAAATVFADAHRLLRVGNIDGALAAWHRASNTRGASVGGVPVDLVARWAECDLLEAEGRVSELKVKAAALQADVYSSRWQLSRTAFETQEHDSLRWLGAVPQTHAVVNARALSSAVEWIWTQWRAAPTAGLERSGHKLLTFDGQRFVLFWHVNPGHLSAFVASSSFMEAEWLPRLRESGARQHLTISLRDPGGRWPAGKEARQVAGETGLPWTVAVGSVASPDARAASGRFRIWTAGVALLALIVVGGTFVIARAAARELAVARLQTDFVAAVSHEFRTPLTSLRQIGEVLHDGRIQSDERRQTYYQALMRQTERLHHLVETLLDFGRMEAGTSPYRKEPIDLPSWTRSVIEQFNLEAAGRGYTVELTVGDEPVPVLADPQALTNALWNLLDNAVKYSPDCRTVWVTVRRNGAIAEVRVQDCGIGVSVAEQRDIFGKFVRGAEAKRQNIPGTGIGLAMVRHIMNAHGGDVRVESRPGDGSTFSLVIPCRAS